MMGSQFKKAMAPKPAQTPMKTGAAQPVADGYGDPYSGNIGGGAANIDPSWMDA